MRIIVTFLTILLTGSLAMASTGETMKVAEAAPLIIDSKDGLTCDREKLMCTAEGEVVIRKGPYEMHSKQAIAFMKKNEQGKLEIQRVEAHDDVRFFGISGETATSEDASYDLDDQLIHLIPAKGKQVTVWKDEYIMLSDDLKIQFNENSDEKLEIDRIDANGHVSLSSPDELIEGNKATMTPKTNLVDVIGDVRVNREQGLLRGPYAQVNLDTKVSKVLNRDSVNTGERVRVFVYPEQVDKKTLKSDENKGSVG
jgi:lipopolysaccharide export system protein LptA